MSTLTECRVGLGKHALVVDDEPIVGQIMCRVLEQLGYRVDLALDGSEAIERAQEHDYQVIVCDILMPRVNGMALYDHWVEQAPELASHTVFVTGDSLGPETNAFIERTGRPCIMKPFRLNDLAEVVAGLQRAVDGAGSGQS